MVDEKEFQEKVQKIARLISGLNDITDNQTRTAAQDLVQLVTDLHGIAVERMMEVIFARGACGVEIIEELGHDRIVSSLLALHGLHPEDVQTRVTRAVEKIAAGLRKQDVELELLEVDAGRVRIRAKTNAHACHSTYATVRIAIEEAVYEAAPDISSLMIEGLEGKDGGGFVELEQLTNTPAPVRLTANEAGD